MSNIARKTVLELYVAFERGSHVVYGLSQASYFIGALYACARREVTVAYLGRRSGNALDGFRKYPCHKHADDAGKDNGHARSRYDGAIRTSTKHGISLGEKHVRVHGPERNGADRFLFLLCFGFV